MISSDFQPVLFSVFFGIAAYLCGSLPFGVWMSQVFGGPKDIRAHGSKSTGATNVLRVSGKKAALLTIILDTLKTFIPVALALKIDIPFVPFIGICGVIGHLFPIFLGFKGGKGVASALGVLLALSWSNALILLIFLGGVVFMTRYVSLASMVVAIVAPFLFWIRGEVEQGKWILLISLLLLWAHRENIKRLVQGKETPLGRSFHGS